MNPTETLRVQFDSIYRSIRANTGDITDDESLITPEGGGNSINWVLGHILLSRNDLFPLLKRNPPVDTEKFHSYRRGSKGAQDAWTVIPLSELKQILDKSQTLLTDAFKTMSLQEDAVKRIAHMCFHEGYHAGQIGLMRRVIGKAGVIK